MSEKLRLSSAFLHVPGEEPKVINIQSCLVTYGYDDFFMGYSDTLSKQLGFRATNYYCTSIGKDYTVVDLDINTENLTVVNLRSASSDRVESLFLHLDDKYPDMAIRVRALNIKSRIKDLSFALTQHPELLSMMFAVWNDVDIIIHAIRPDYPDGRPRALQVASIPRTKLPYLNLMKATCRLDPDAVVQL